MGSVHDKEEKEELDLEQKMQTWRLTVAYDGSHFHGWQAQPGLATVQGALQEALRAFKKGEIEVQGAGRTDAGVHALGQVASCAFESDLTERKMLLAMASLLPPAVRVLKAEKMPMGFNAKHHSIGKRYVYRVVNADVVSPFKGPYAWQVKASLNVEKMKAAAQNLLGEKDFESFRSVHCDAGHARRFLWRADVVQDQKDLSIEIRGNAFCRNMIRIIAGTLVDVGRGKIDHERMTEIIEAKNREAAGITAPAHGLFLDAVYYPDQLDEAGIPASAIFPNHPWTETFWPPRLKDELPGKK